MDELNKKEIKTDLVVLGKEKSLSPDLEINLFRMAQEAANNIKKHSRATRASITIIYAGAKVKLTVWDNGQGFKLPASMSDLANQSKLGLIGIGERARCYGGAFSLRSQLRKGTKLTIILPVLKKSSRSGSRCHEP